MTKVSLKKLFDKTPKKEKKNVTNAIDKKMMLIAFNILAIFCIILFTMAITPKTLQNDTFYTIKIGQDLRKSGLDYVDHYSWNYNLPYMYPHWLYDLVTSLVFDYCGGYTGIYVMTLIIASTLGILIYFANKRFSKNDVVSFVLTMFQMYMMKDYIAARAQLVTFCLFVLTIILIERFLEKPNWKDAIGLIIIPIVIANIHSAVFPFYFILYLPYLGEYIISVILDAHIIHKIYTCWLKMHIKLDNNKLKKAKKDQTEYYKKKLVELNEELEKSDERFEKFLSKQMDRRKNPFKIKIKKNKNIIKLFIIMLVCILTGLLTPIKDMPYTYTYKIMKGNTTQSISEHLPLTLIENIPLVISFAIFYGMLIFTRVKLTLKDWFFVGGLTLLAFMSRRQVSMLILFDGFIFGKMVAKLFDKYDKKGTEELIKFMTTVAGELLTILLVLSIAYTQYRPKINDQYIDSNSYPVEASEWIKENLDYKNIKLFNDYNYGSYLLLQDIPVFIDSRCDLYTPEFNGTYNKETKKYEGRDIFSDYMDVSGIRTYYDTKFEDYGVTHIITKKNSKLKMLLSKDKGYKELYSDDGFIIFEKE